MAVSDGFQSTTLPINAGAEAKFPPIAEKLKGLTAATKPQRKFEKGRNKGEVLLLTNFKFFML